MNDYIQQQLNKVLLLNKEKQQALEVVKQTKTKRRGSHLVTISKEEKEQMTAKVNKVYTNKINQVYKSLNSKLTESGHNTIENPFIERKDEI